MHPNWVVILLAIIVVLLLLIFFVDVNISEDDGEKRGAPGAPVALVA